MTLLDGAVLGLDLCFDTLHCACPHYSLPPWVPNRYTVYIDGVDKKSGSLFDDFEPPFLPPKEIPDAEDKKPEDWVDTAK